jgi:peptidoglycan/LPS O-acetylase OafA/YrhL
VNKNGIPIIDWINPLKVFALLGVLLNHLVEELEPGSWFTQPSSFWARFLAQVPNFVTGDSLPVSMVKILAWVGDFSPGVFIFVSGFGLSWAALHSEQDNIDWKRFLQRRILRILPLYVFLNLLFLTAKLIKNGGTITFANPSVLLSILGIRITDELFFYINPSWWFVWLIFQLYIVFPLLYILLRKLGIGRFLLLTCLFTFLSRLSGLFGLRYSESLYFWMLGIFFGTRLAEFCVGMVLAVLLKEGVRGRAQQLGKPKYVFLFSILILSLGLVSFFVRYGELVDYFLVTLGLSGLFYSAWKAVFEKRKRLTHFITMLGAESYGIYLVHQLILQRVGQFLSSEWRLIGLIAAILISFPIGIYLTRFTNLFIQKVKELRKQEVGIPTT